MIYLKKIIPLIIRSKALIVVTLFVSLLFIPSIFVAPKNNLVTETNKEETLGIASKVTPTPTPTITPSPTPVLILAKNPSPTPTPTPTPLIATPTPTPQQTSTSNPNPSPTATPTPTPTPTVTPTPTPVSPSIEIGIDYAGQKSNDTYTIAITPNQTAWETVSSAIGIENLAYTDYGGDLGIFITGFNGINAASNQFYEFRVNGTSSNVGVSTYQVNSGDRLDFVLTTF
ncbi:MAG: DUF4430 domain-containing protein [Patescibacteria group bacterium]